LKLIKEKRKTISCLLVAIILLAVLVFPYQAKAACPLNPGDCVTGALQEINKILLEGVGYVIAWAAKTLEAVVRPETQAIITNTFVVRESWRIVRDFMNMFFILFLIIMAFGTIFDIDKYHWRNLLPYLLIAALLINFSMVIGEYIIKIGNGLAAVFLRQISGFGNDMANGFALGETFPNQEFSVQGLAMIANNSARVIITALFSIVFLIIALFAFIAALLFAVIRIPILWLLLIVSPIAWAGYVLPNIRAKTWSKWWNALISWSFFLPVYLFFLMFAVMFIRRKSEIEASISNVQGVSLFTGPGGALSDLLFYILTLIFMIFGLKAAYSVGSFAAEGAGKLMGKLESGVRKYAPGAAYVRGAWEGLKARGEEIKEKGILGFGGAQRAREAEARMKGWVAGLPGPGQAPAAREVAKGTIEKQLMEKVNKLKSQFEMISDLGKLRRLAFTGSKDQQLAAREVLRDRGELSIDELLATYQLYGGRSSLAAQNFAKNIDFARMSSEERSRLFNEIEDPEIKRKIINIRAEKGDLRSATAEELQRYATLFTREGDKIEFLNKAQKFAFEEALRAQVNLGLIKDSAGNVITDLSKALADKVRKMRLDDILELSKGSLRGLIQNPETSRIIGARLNKETIASLPGKVDSEVMEILEEVISRRKRELETEETERQQREAAVQGEAQARAMQPLVDAIRELTERIRR